MGRRGEELPDGLLEGLDRDSLVSLGDALDQVRNVVEQLLEPGLVVFHEHLARLLPCLGRVGLDHLLPAAEDEVGLHVQGLLAPQRAVVVERAGPETDPTNSRTALFAAPWLELGSSSLPFMI